MTKKEVRELLKEIKGGVFGFPLKGMTKKQVSAHLDYCDCPGDLELSRDEWMIRFDKACKKVLSKLK